MKRLAIGGMVLTGVLWASLADAAVPYYEFNPDGTNPVSVNAAVTTDEVFLPLNEFLSGFDFWFSDGGSSVPATFTLLNASGTDLGSRTVTIPAIADSDHGSRVHVDLPAQVSVVPAGQYRVRISTSAQTLHAYEAPAVQLLTHDASIPPAFLNGGARLNGEDQAYSFAFALYESRETVPPVVSNTGVSQTNIDTAVLSFNANEPVDWHIQYGGNIINWTGVYATCVPGVQTCTTDLPVVPGTVYTYTLTARDTWGNESTFSGTFTSQANGQAPTATPVATPGATRTPTPSPTPTPDTVPPVVTNARVVNLTPESAGFAWTTDEAANGNVVVQLSPILITVSGNSDSTLELEHYITVGNLTSDTYYQTTILTADSVNNTTTVTLKFLTPRTTPTPRPTTAPPPTTSGTPAPVQSPVVTVSTTPTIDAKGPGDQPVLSWPAPPSGEPSGGYRIDVFDQQNHLIRSVIIPAGTHEAALRGLELGTTRVVVYANNDGVYQKVAAATTIRIQKRSLLETAYGYALYILGGIVLLIAITIVVLKMRAPKPAAQ